MKGLEYFPLLRQYNCHFASPFQRYQGSGSDKCEKYHKYFLVHLKFLNIWSNCDIEIVRIFGLRVPGDKKFNVHHHESLSSYYSGSEVNNFMYCTDFYFFGGKNSLLWMIFLHDIQSKYLTLRSETFSEYQNKSTSYRARKS